MKKIVLLLTTLSSISAFAETITIVQPLIEIVEHEGYAVAAKTSGSFSSILKSKESCIQWVNDGVKKLQTAGKVVFSATCSNNGIHKGTVRTDGTYYGFVSYL